MYCGTNKTALASQRHIADALMRLIQEKPFARITVSELCKEAGISRQTFYTLFTSRENVVAFTLHAQYCYTPSMPVARDVKSSRSLRALCRGYSEYIYENQRLIKTLVDNHIDYLLYDSFFDALDSCDCFLQNVDPCTRRYAAGFYAGGISSVARRYAQEGCSISSDRLEELLVTLFSGGLL